MAVNKDPIAKKCRKFDISPAVMGYGNKKSTRNPGGNRRKKVSEYGAQLQENTSSTSAIRSSSARSATAHRKC